MTITVPEWFLWVACAFAIVDVVVRARSVYWTRRLAKTREQITVTIRGHVDRSEPGA